jgi:hypothetical protein
MSFYGELKRRNVFNVALFYLAVGWLMLQATDVLGSLLELPIWVGKLVIFLLALGLPVALILSWLYEMTPEGLKRDSALDPNESRRQETVSRLNLLTIIAALAHRHHCCGPPCRTERAGRETGPGSYPGGIALCQFEHRRGPGVFADGITEEILNLLANVQGLQVTSHIVVLIQESRRLATIARKLGVSHVVEAAFAEATACGSRRSSLMLMRTRTSGLRLMTGSDQRI